MCVSSPVGTPVFGCCLPVCAGSLCLCLLCVHARPRPFVRARPWKWAGGPRRAPPGPGAWSWRTDSLRGAAAPSAWCRTSSPPLPPLTSPQRQPDVLQLLRALRGGIRASSRSAPLHVDLIRTRERGLMDGAAPANEAEHEHELKSNPCATGAGAACEEPISRDRPCRATARACNWGFFFRVPKMMVCLWNQNPRTKTFC